MTRIRSSLPWSPHAVGRACGLLALAIATIPVASASESVLYTFSTAEANYSPGTLLLASDGNFYGTSFYGGASGNGSVYKVTPQGVYSTVLSFNGSNGIAPSAKLIQGSDGYLYGTTEGGGSAGCGVAFRLNTSGAMTTLANFTTANCYPGPLMQANDGNFYGVSAGSNTYGSAFKMTPSGSVSTLVTFNEADGSVYESDSSVLVQGPDGNLYGTTFYGGTDNLGGTVFRLSLGGSLTTLFNFVDPTGSAISPDGFQPAAGLVVGADGNLYGTTSNGGAHFLGTVFRITTAGSLTTLASFDCTHGVGPTSALIQASDGLLYGASGGKSCGGSLMDLGAAFRVNSDNTLSTVNYFNSVDWGTNVGGLVQDSSGKLFGTVGAGGMSNGIIYQLNSTLPVPDGLTATAGNGQVRLNWKSVSGASGYRIYSGTASGQEGNTAIQSTATNTATVTGLTNDTTYNFTVAAYNSAATGSPSLETHGMPVAPPPVPTLLTANGGNKSVSLSWSAAHDAQTYNVYMGTTPGGEGTFPKRSKISGTVVTISALTNGKPYFFKVAAVNVSGTSTESNELSATPIAPPAAPTNLKATTAPTGGVTLSWAAAPGATSYDVWFATVSGKEPSGAQRQGITSTSTTVTGIAAGATYYFEVAGVNGGGIGTKSVEVSAVAGP